MVPLVLISIGVTLGTWLVLSGPKPQTIPHGVDNLHQAMLQRSIAERLFKPAGTIIGSALNHLLPHRRVDVLYERAITAGIQGFWTKSMIAVSRLVSLLSSVAVAWLVWSVRPGILTGIMAVLIVMIGWQLVDTMLTNRARVRQDIIVSSLPDYADQIAICVQAGLNLDQAIRRTADTNDGPISDEFHRFLRDLRVGMRRPDAYAALSERIDLGDMSQFVRALSSAERNGVSIAQVLEVQAEELRNQRFQRAEERAMRLPVLMLFPLTFCIVPALLAVLLGPVLLELFRTGLGT